MIAKNIQHNTTSGDRTEQDYHKVLVVDDEPAICFAYKKLFESERFGFDVCERIEAARELLNNNEYFAVISDVRFAGSGNMDGVHFISTVRQAQPEANVILVTGYGNDEIKKTAFSLGASHYFEKPVRPSLILSLLRTLHLVEDEREQNNYIKSL